MTPTSIPTRTLTSLAFVFTTMVAVPAFAQDAGPGSTADAPAPTDTPPAPTEDNKGVQVQLFDGGDVDDDDPMMVLRNMPPDARQKLTGDQIEQIVRRAQQNQRSSPAEIENILIPTVFFLTIVGVVGIVLFARQRRERQLHETLRMMVEKGADIPPALLVPQRPKDADRRRGLILLSVGAGLMIFFAAVDNSGSWGIGAVPALIGVGYLLAWWMGKREGAPE